MVLYLNLVGLPFLMGKRCGKLCNMVLYLDLVGLLFLIGTGKAMDVAKCVAWFCT
jgi:hypothetical protein